MMCRPRYLWMEENYVILDIDGGVGRIVLYPEFAVLKGEPPWQHLDHFWDPWDDLADPWLAEWAEWLPEQ